MANFTAAINCLVAERDRVFLVRVAEDYKIPFEELQQKYLETAEAIKVPRKYKKREPKLVEVTNADGETVKVSSKKEASPKEKKVCEAQTSKKEPCKFPALKGGCFCKRHQRQHDEKEDGVPPAPKAKKEPVKKQEQPLHNHALDVVAADCDLCSSHGNPLNGADEDFEIVMPVEAESNAPVEAKTTADRLASILAEAESESDSEEYEATSFESEYEDE
jgi:antitoxin component of RelBE/YafQ-DinJ toxin-antitoxin module